MTNYAICMISVFFLAYLVGSHYKKFDTVFCSIIVIATFIRYWPSLYTTTVGIWASYVQYVGFILYMGFSFYTADKENKKYQRQRETKIVSMFLFACFMIKKIAVNFFLERVCIEDYNNRECLEAMKTAGIVFHLVECCLIFGLFFLYWIRNTKKRL